MPEGFFLVVWVVLAVATAIADASSLPQLFSELGPRLGRRLPTLRALYIHARPGKSIAGYGRVQDTSWRWLGILHRRPAKHAVLFPPPSIMEVADANPGLPFSSIGSTQAG